MDAVQAVLRGTAMMGYREKFKGGDEYDALTKARRTYGPPAGVVKRIKQAFQRRLRRAMRQVLGRER